MPHTIRKPILCRAQIRQICLTLLVSVLIRVKTNESSGSFQVCELDPSGRSIVSYHLFILHDVSRKL